MLRSQPVVPVLPVSPVAPVIPVVPVSPVAPVLPVAPVNPVEPVAPVLPVGPWGKLPPVPVSGIVRSGRFDLITRLAVRVPAAPGENRTVIWQVPSTGRSWRQVLEPIKNSSGLAPVNSNPEIRAVAPFPVSVTV